MSRKSENSNTSPMPATHNRDDERSQSVINAVYGAERLRQARRQLQELSGSEIIVCTPQNTNRYAQLGGNPFNEPDNDVHPGPRTLPPPRPASALPSNDSVRDDRLPELSHRTMPKELQQRPSDQGSKWQKVGEARPGASGIGGTRYEVIRPESSESNSEPPERTASSAEHGPPGPCGYIPVHLGHERARASRLARTFSLPNRSAANFGRQARVKPENPQEPPESVPVPRKAVALARNESSSVSNRRPERRRGERGRMPSKAEPKRNSPTQTSHISPVAPQPVSSPATPTRTVTTDTIRRHDFAQGLPREDGVTPVPLPEQALPQHDESLTEPENWMPVWMADLMSRQAPVPAPEAENTPVESAEAKTKKSKTSFRKSMSMSLGKAKGKLAGMLRDVVGTEDAEKTKREAEIAMRSTKVYLNDFSKRSAFTRDYTLINEINKVYTKHTAHPLALPAESGPGNQSVQQGQSNTPGSASRSTLPASQQDPAAGRQDGDNGNRDRPTPRQRPGRRT